MLRTQVADRVIPPFDPSLNSRRDVPAGAEARRRASESAAAAFDSLVGRELGDRYCVTGILGRSEQAVLYAATDVALGRPVALRAIARAVLARDDLAAILAQSLAATASLDHPHVVRIYESGTTPGLHWYAARLVDGMSLETVLRDRGVLEAGQCLRLAEQVASALHYAHRLGVVHGALSADRILVQGDEWVLVSDFATGAIMDRALETAEAPRGLASLAPEAATDRDIGPAADQYSLAVTLYSCLTGRSPGTDGDESAAGPERSSNGAQGREGAALPIHMQLAFRRAMSPRPMDRFPTVLDFVGALRAPDGARSLMGPPRAREVADEHQRMRFLEEPAPQSKRRGLMAGAFAVACAAALAVALLPGKDSAASDAAPIVLTPTWTERPAPPAPEPSSSVSDSLAVVLDPYAADARDPIGPMAMPAPAARPDPPPVQTPATRNRPSSPSPVTRAVPQAAVADLTPGRLSIGSYPWGTLTIDGRTAGTTPLENVAVPPGTHTLRITQDGFRPLERVVTVAPGQAIRLTDLTLEAAP